MGAYNKFATTVRKISHAASYIAMAVVFVITVVLVVDIVLRLVTEKLAVTGSYELTEMAMVIIVFLGLAVTQVEKGHVRVTMVVDRLPRRAKAYANALTATFSTVIGGVLFYAGVLQALGNSTSGITTAVLYIPIAPFAWIMVLGLLLLTLAFLLDAIDYWLLAIGKQPRDASEQPRDESTGIPGAC